MPNITELQRLGALSSLLAEIDDWCGTVPHGHFPPPPPPPPWLRDTLVAVAIGRLASEISNEDLRGQVTKLTAKLLELKQR